MESTEGSSATRVLAQEVERRRTFAIISHPDAGKTTLTEKLLLFGGALREAGAVRAQRANRHATSDWLELEKQRGISVSSSVMHFEYQGFRVNILDTPGHKDFSEDTYRTLMAADAAVMLIDGAKGVEAQTGKLFQVCAMRKIPIFTFVNKMDREGRDALDLMQEIEEVLGIEVVPVNWPVGMGSGFRGVYNRLEKKLELFSGGKHGTELVNQVDVEGEPGSSAIQEAIGGAMAQRIEEELELLDGAGAEFDEAAVRAGTQTPMFFGSAMTNFGVLPFLDAFLKMAPHPSARHADQGPVDPVERGFSGFIFKIQANMDPNHRDRLAFMRVCSGKFVRGANVQLERTGKSVRLAKSTLLMAADREEVDEAFPGDVVGLHDPGIFRIGDTLSEEGDLSYPGIPSFSPECFMAVDVSGVEKRKALDKGLQQLAQEGAVQLFTDMTTGVASPIMGAVGQLQFEVLIHRMQTEYKVKLKLAPLPYQVARWPQGGFDPDIFRFSETAKVVEDRDGRSVVLFKSLWNLDWVRQKYPDLELAETADMHLFAAGQAKTH